MTKWIGLAFLTVSLLIFEPAHALFEVSAAYASEALATDTSVTSNFSFFDFAYTIRATKGNWFWIGWSFASQASNDTLQNAFTGTAHGPRFLLQLGKSAAWTIGLNYLLISTGNYTPVGGTASEWQGTTIKADLGYAFELSEESRFGIRLNYVSNSYNKQFTNGAFAEISYSKSLITPAVAFIWNY